MNTPENNSARGARDDAPRGERGDNDNRGGRGRRDNRDRGGTRGRNDRKQDERGGGRGQQNRRGGHRKNDRDRSGRDAHQGGRDDRQRRGDKDREARGDRDRGERGGRGPGGGRGQQNRRGGYRQNDREHGGRDQREDRDRRDGQERRDDRDRRGTGGQRKRDAGGRIRNEAQLSRAARDRLKALRTDYSPQDEDRHTGDERDTYADVPGGIRLQKALASAGIASRRASEEMIAAGRVSVDGQTVRRFGARVDPETSEIRVDDMRVVTAPDRLYFALNKPRGVVSTMWDPQGRPSLADYTGETTERIFHVGRLDTETEGLILLTNDGDLANRLTHPRYKVAKTYIAKVPGPVPQRVVRQLRRGIELDDGPVEIDSFRVVDNVEPRALVEVRLHEGRKHIVRRLMEAVDHPVTDLARTQIGPINLNTLKLGTMRALSSREVGELYAAAGL